MKRRAALGNVAAILAAASLPARAQPRGKVARVGFLASEGLRPRLEELRPVALGGFVSYGPDAAALYRRTAFYVDKILRGARPADLPVEQPAIQNLRINLKTAKLLGIEIPKSVLFRADEVIQ